MNEFNCDICNKQYKTSQSFWNHKNKYHKLDLEKIYKCDYCEKSYPRNNALSRHMNVCRLKNKPEQIINNQCDKCYYIFKSKKGFNGHKCKIISTGDINGEKNIIIGHDNNGTIHNGDNHINILNFEDVNATSLSYDNIKEIIENSEYKKIINLLYFNKDIPKNHVICKQKLNTPHVLVRECGKIMKKNISYYYGIIKEKAKENYHTILDILKNKISEDQLNKITLRLNRHISHLDKEEKQFVDYIDETLYNNNDMIQKTWDDDKIEDSKNDDIDYNTFWTKSDDVLFKEAEMLADNILKTKNYDEDKYKKKRNKYIEKYITKLYMLEIKEGKHNKKIWESEQ